jgi:tetratricopeptide (TPR) repeat protein
MLVQTAEESFQKGLESISQGRRKEAMALFEAAIELERKFGSHGPQARYLSYYGLCLALEKNEIREGLRFCREAVTLESYNSDMRCNLGRVLMRAGRRKEAYASFVRGLSLQSDHKAIRRALRAMGIRRRPVLPFLARRHPLNILLGRLRPEVKSAA